MLRLVTLLELQALLRIVTQVDIPTQGGPVPTLLRLETTLELLTVLRFEQVVFSAMRVAVVALH